MGDSSSRCFLNCFSHEHNSSEIRKKYKKLYKQRYSDHIFGQIALATLKNFGQEDLNEVEGQYLKKSIIETHYDQSQINYVVEDQDQVSFSIINMNSQEKERHLLRLLKESYILLDLSDLLEKSYRMTYERQVKNQLMENKQSFLSKNPLQTIQDMLRQFDPVVLSRLGDYVKFCSEVKDQFLVTSQNFYSTLLIRLKASVIEKHRLIVKNLAASTNTKKFIEMLKNDVVTMCNLIMETVFIQFSISNKYLEEQSCVNFYNETNVYTMIMTLIFGDKGFSDFIKDIVQKYIHTDLKIYMQSPITKNNQLIKALKEVEGEGKKDKKNNLQGRYANVHDLFQPRNQTSKYKNIFNRSCKIMKMVNQKQQPISKLKIFYELFQEIKRQFNQVFEEEDHSVSFTRQSQTLIAKWMLNRQKNINKDTIISILITYWFIQQRYLQVEKGSCLIPFVEQVQTIIKWNNLK